MLTISKEQYQKLEHYAWNGFVSRAMKSSAKISKSVLPSKETT